VGKNINTIRGFQDVLPDEIGKWQFLEARARFFLENFGFREIRPPILERTELFQRGIGTSTDVVEKEMFTFIDRNHESLTLRPEATAGVIRSYIENNIFKNESVSKLYTIGPMFRRERPQKGRYRQFHQINAEVLGVSSPVIDAEIMFMLQEFFKDIGLNSFELSINSLGCSECIPLFKGKLMAFLEQEKGSLCDDCRRRSLINPLRVFDCKEEACRNIMEKAPTVGEHICLECKSHFEGVQRHLENLGVNYIIDQRMVRGLDYYHRTVFEITAKHLGAQNALCGGGRYNSLVEQLGGPDTPGMGFAIGFERLVSLVPPERAFSKVPTLFIAALGEAAQEKTSILLNTLRLAGLYCESDYGEKSLKALMKRADKLNANFAMIIGEEELFKGMAIFKNMHSGTQTPLALDDTRKIIAFLKGEVL